MADPGRARAHRLGSPLYAGLPPFLHALCVSVTDGSGNGVRAHAIGEKIIIVLHSRAKPMHKDVFKATEIKWTGQLLSSHFISAAYRRFEHALRERVCIDLEIWRLFTAPNSYRVTEQRNVACHMGLHSFICRQTQVNATRFIRYPLYPHSNRPVLDLPTPEGWKTELILRNWYIVLSPVMRYITLRRNTWKSALSTPRLMCGVLSH